MKPRVLIPTTWRTRWDSQFYTYWSEVLTDRGWLRIMFTGDTVEDEAHTRPERYGRMWALIERDWQDRLLLT